MIEVRRIEAHDGPLLRATRLAALADSPGDSTTTVANNEAHPPEHWDRAAAANAAGASQATFFASRDGDAQHVVGMIGAYVTSDGVATMVGLWSAPGHRDVGVGDALVDAVLDWARRGGAERARLWVVERNEYARRFYETKGFEATGQTMPYEPQPTIQQVEMAIRL